MFSDGCCIDFETAPGKADGWPYEGIQQAVSRCPHGRLYELSYSPQGKLGNLEDAASE